MKNSKSAYLFYPRTLSSPLSATDSRGSSWKLAAGHRCRIFAQSELHTQIIVVGSHSYLAMKISHQTKILKITPIMWALCLVIYYALNYGGIIGQSLFLKIF